MAEQGKTRGDATKHSWHWGQLTVSRNPGRGLLLFVPGMERPIRIDHDETRQVKLRVLAPMSVSIVRDELVCLIGGGR